MSDPRPMGMRIQRPYQTEEEFIQGDGLTIGRTGMILLGAPARPPGIIIRFELVLADGSPVFRGEGKVVAFRVHSNGRKGLEVRFTRLDAHSRGVIEKALELRKSGALTPASAVNQIPDLTPSPASSRVAPRQEIVIKGPEPVSAPVSEPIPVSVSEPEPVSAPVSEPIPVSVSEPEPVSAPIPASISEPVSAPAPVSAPIPVSISEPEPVSAPAPVSAPIPVSISEPEPEPIEPPLEDDATPFAPPVFLAEEGEPPSVERLRTELDKLRERRAEVATPSGRDHLLARLRGRHRGG